LVPQQPVTFGRRGARKAAPDRLGSGLVAPTWRGSDPSPVPGTADDDLTYAALLHRGASGDDEARMRRFIGPNWSEFEKLWRAMGPEGALVPSFSAAAFSFSIGWLFYRRLYGFGVAAVVAEIAIARLSPINSTIADFLLCLAIGAFGKALVVRKGLRTIDAVSRAGLSEGETAARIERFGGVRLAEALAASILLAGFGAASVFRMFSAGLPADLAAPLDGLQEVLKVL
jgi:hypothetical protein